jgi:hypothetical protein
VNRILILPPEFAMDIQVQIPCALAATHNFIRIHDSSEISTFTDILADVPSVDSYGSLSPGPARRAEKARATNDRDVIAQQMWDDYVVYRQEFDVMEE